MSVSIAPLVRFARGAMQPQGRRAVGALALSLILHLASGFFWPSGALPVSRHDRPVDASEVTFAVVAPPKPSARKLVVVVVGPGPAGRGSPRGRVLTGDPRTRARPPSVATPVAEAPGLFAPTLAPTDVREAAPTPSSAPSGGAPPASSSNNGRTFEELIEAQGLLLAAGRGGGYGGFGSCRGPHCPSLALGLDVSGRQVAGSPVVGSPIVVHDARTPCELPAGRFRAVVRLLVLRDGTPSAARVLESSGQAAFDQCALHHASGLRFSPGVDRAGRPLDVWVHVGISGDTASLL